MSLLQWPVQVSTLSEVSWFSSPESHKPVAEASIRKLLSDIGAGNLPVRWLNKEDLASFIESYQLNNDPIWPKLYEVPQQISDLAEAKGLKKEISFTMNEVPEHLFHSIYDGAFHAFEQQGEQVITHAVVAALYMASLSVSLDTVGEQNSVLTELLEVLRLGFLPLGVKDSAFYVY